MSGRCVLCYNSKSILRYALFAVTVSNITASDQQGTMIMTKNIITTTCSGCGEKIVLNTILAQVRVAVPGGVAIGELWYQSDGLLSWDCPRCDYADSFEDD